MEQDREGDGSKRIPPGRMNGCLARAALGPTRAAFVALVVATGAGCDAADEHRVTALAIDSAGVELVTSDPTTSVFSCEVNAEPTLSIGGVLRDEEVLFSSVRGVGMLSDGSIVVADRIGSDMIRIFDRTGTLVRSFGRRGEGPGEFRDPWMVYVVAGDTIHVGDYRPMRYNVFTSEGEWVRAVQLEPLYLNPSHGGGVLVGGRTVNTRETADYGSSSAATAVELHDTDGRLLRELAHLGGPEQISTETAVNLVMTPLFAPRPEVSARRSTIALAEGDESEVRFLDADQGLVRIVRWTPEDLDVTRADIDAFRRTIREQFVDRPEIAAELTSEDRPVNPRFPAVSHLLVGATGRIWVGQYPRPSAPEPRRARIFGADGRFQCHVTRPPGFTPWEFGADYLLGVQEDELGVEYVALHELLPPADPAATS